jgi:hypothetical protein
MQTSLGGALTVTQLGKTDRFSVSSATFEKPVTTSSDRRSVLARYSPHIAQHGANCQHVSASSSPTGRSLLKKSTVDG